MEGLKEFLTLTYFDGPGYGAGYGCGAGLGPGYGYGSGQGAGYGDGEGFGDGCGYGSGYGDGDGSGFGHGCGSGFGSDDGSGYGYFGYCEGAGIKMFNGDKVYYIDGIPTVILSVNGHIARGYVINKDLTTKSIYIVRVENSFAHGETIEKARANAEEKIE